MIIYSFLKQNSSPLLKKKNFLLLLQQCINYNISNKQQLLKFMNWSIKKYFSIKEIIKIINNNPLLENKINENIYMKKKVDEFLPIQNIGLSLCNNSVGILCLFI